MHAPVRACECACVRARARVWECVLVLLFFSNDLFRPCRNSLYGSGLANHLRRCCGGSRTDGGADPSNVFVYGYVRLFSQIYCSTLALKAKKNKKKREKIRGGSNPWQSCLTFTISVFLLKVAHKICRFSSVPKIVTPYTLTRYIREKS